MVISVAGPEVSISVSCCSSMEVKRLVRLRIKVERKVRFKLIPVKYPTVSRGPT